MIPTQRDRKLRRPYNRDRYRVRNLAERFWRKVKQYRHVAARYEKTASYYLGFVQGSSILLFLQ